MHIAILRTKLPRSSVSGASYAELCRVSRSSDVLPQIKEYERVSTTVVNAYVGPTVRLYLNNLEQRLKQADQGEPGLILSHGGMAPVEEAARLAAGTVQSGPAGGISGCRRCVDLLGIPNLISFDMGGTSTDISLVTEGHAALSPEGGLAGQRIALRSLDIASIAAGGDRLLASTPAGPSMSARKVLVRCPDLLAMPTAAQRRRSRMRTSFLATSMPPPLWEGVVRLTKARRKWPSIAWRRRLDYHASKPPPVSTG